MKDMNRVFLLGRLGTDPVRRTTRNGTAVVHFPLATSRTFKSVDEAGVEKQNEETEWHEVVVWGKQAEVCAQYLVCGQKALVEGEIRSHKYETKEGSPRMAFEVHAESVSFLDKPRAKRESEALQPVM